MKKIYKWPKIRYLDTNDNIILETLLLIPKLVEDIKGATEEEIKRDIELYNKYSKIYDFDNFESYGPGLYEDCRNIHVFKQPKKGTDETKRLQR